MPPVNGVGEPGVGEPRARFDAAGAGNGVTNLVMVIGESTADRETGGRQAPSPTARRRHRASSRPYNLTALVSAGERGLGRGEMRLPVRQQSTKIRCPNREPRCCHTAPRLRCLTAPLSAWPTRSAPTAPNAAPAGAASAPGNKPSWSWPTCAGGDTYARLTGGFAIGTTTAWRYVREAVDLVAALADDVHTAARKASRLAYAIGDGTLLPIDRPAGRRCAVLLRETPPARGQRPVPRRPGRPAGAGLARAARRGARSDRRPADRPDRRPHRRRYPGLRRPGIPGRGRCDPDPVQAPPAPAAPVTQPEVRQPRPRPHPGDRRTRRRDPEGMEGRC